MENSLKLQEKQNFAKTVLGDFKNQRIYKIFNIEKHLTKNC